MVSMVTQAVSPFEFLIPELLAEHVTKTKESSWDENGPCGSFPYRWLESKEAAQTV